MYTPRKHRYSASCLFTWCLRMPTNIRCMIHLLPLLNALKFLTSPKKVSWLFFFKCLWFSSLLVACNDIKTMAIIPVLWISSGQKIAVCSTPLFAKARFPFSAWDLNFWNALHCRDLKLGLNIWVKTFPQVQEDFYNHSSWGLHLIISGEY